jgi:hypothetical protein
MLSRRDLTLAGSGFAAVALAPRPTLGEGPAAPEATVAGPFTLDPLTYPANAREGTW